MTDEIVSARGVRETIHQTILAVMADVGAIGKDGINVFQHYNFRGIDQVMNAFQAPMVQHGLFVIPTVVSSEHRQIQTTNTVQTEAILLVEFTFYNRDGDALTVTVQGEGRDTSDKASNKAMSAALKYAMLFTFMVPVDGAEDADSTTLEAEVAAASETTIDWGKSSQWTAMDLAGDNKVRAKALYTVALADVGIEAVTTEWERDAVVVAMETDTATFDKPELVEDDATHKAGLVVEEVLGLEEGGE